MDPTAADVRAGIATYDVNTGSYVWLPGSDPNPPAAVWDSGTGNAVVTVSAPAQPDHSALWLVLALGVTWWVLEG